MVSTLPVLLLFAQALAPQGGAQGGLHTHQSSEPCAAPGRLPPALSGWSRPQPLRAGGATDESLPVLTLGRAATLRLAGATADMRGGAIAFDVAEPGTYRVALEHKGWIDVVEDGRSLESSSHGHGPACTGIRKIVDFRLKRGRHVLRLSKLAEDEVRVLIARG